MRILEYRPWEGESYMGLFPRTVGKRFSRARTGASWGAPSAAPSARAREREEGRCPGRIMQNLASLSGTTTSGVDWYAFHVIVGAGIPTPDRVYAGS